MKSFMLLVTAILCLKFINFRFSTWEPVRTHSSTLLANVLFYNTTNRVRFLEIDGSMEMLIRFVRDRSGPYLNSYFSSLSFFFFSGYAKYFI